MYGAAQETRKNAMNRARAARGRLTDNALQEGELDMTNEGYHEESKDFLFTDKPVTHD